MASDLTRTHTKPSMTERNGPLAGCRVLDLGIITAGASTSALLADLGADVVKVESGSYIDPFRTWDGRSAGIDWWNHSRFFRFTNRNKRGIGLDLKSDAGRALFLRLVSKADIVLENFRRGVLERLNLTFADLVEANPRIILASITSQGERGPDRAAASYGSTLEATSGLASTTGYPGGPPIISGLALNYPDQIVSIFAAGVVIAAVMERDYTGEAIHLDISQRELASFLIGEAIVARPRDGTQHQAERNGNADPTVALQTCVRAAGGEWLTLRVPDLSALARLPGLSSLDEDGLRRWACERPFPDIAQALRAAGLHATKVLDGHQMHDAITEGTTRMALARDTQGKWAKGFPFQFRSRPMRIVRSAPSLGEHTTEVLREYLALSESEIAALAEAGTTATEPTQ
jgi:crotonobetainyl-CoA:carnitine CoA-transferase CaiB-like acyl-CoA transferase